MPSFNQRTLNHEHCVHMTSLIIITKCTHKDYIMYSHTYTPGITYTYTCTDLDTCTSISMTTHTTIILDIISWCNSYVQHHTDITLCTTTQRHTTLHSVTHIHNTVLQQSTHIHHVSINLLLEISSTYINR